MRRRTAVSTLTAGTAALLLAATLAPAGAAAAPVGCDPGRVRPDYRGAVPSPRDVLGLDLGDRDVTVEESDRYLAAVDAASDSVATRTLATSVQGRPLRAAVVATPERLARLEEIGADLRALRDPATPPGQATSIRERSPVVLWLAGNVHGDEESGTDASLDTLRRLADSADCAARRILADAVVVILPTQNPDGRTADRRRNDYGFDLNRDWFARTQPETDGKIEALWALPPQLFIDDHEQGGEGYFFPPNADPVYHEVSDASVSWINERYGAAMARAFRAQGISFFNEDVYDLFYMGYGDTVPSAGFTAAGMTFEVADRYSAAARLRSQSLAVWVSLYQGAVGRDFVLDRYRRTQVSAAKQGAEGWLKPNRVYNEGNTVQNEVPRRPVRSYFIRTDDPARAREVDVLIRRLQRMDVEVRALTAPLAVPDFTPYGDATRAVTLPAGTLWVSMAQGQKHWIQAMLNEDTYVPFPYFYDVTAWSSPLLLDLDGGYSGAAVAPASRVLAPVAAPAAPTPPAGPAPRVAVLAPVDDSSATDQSVGWLRWRLERDWRLPFSLVTAADVAAGALASYDVLLVADQDSDAALAALGSAGRAAVRGFVRDGGHYLGWRGGTRLAVALGLSSVTLAEAGSDVPGSLFESRVSASPLTAGLGEEAWAYYAYDDVMRPTGAAEALLTFPPGGFVSGFASGADELDGTAAAATELRGAGRVTVLSIEPNFRGFTDGTARLVWNAVTADPTGPADAGSAAGRAEPLAAEQALALPAERDPIRVSVPASAAAATAGVLDRLGATYRVQRGADRVRFVVPGGASVDRHPWARRLPAELRAAGVRPIAVTLPTG